MSATTLTRVWVNLVSTAAGISIMLNRVDAKPWRGSVPCFVNLPVGAVQFVETVLGLTGWATDPATGKKRAKCRFSSTIEVDESKLVRHRAKNGNVSLALDARSEESFAAFLKMVIDARREIGSVDPAIESRAKALLAAAGIELVQRQTEPEPEFDDGDPFPDEDPA